MKTLAEDNLLRVVIGCNAAICHVKLSITSEVKSSPCHKSENIKGYKIYDTPAINQSCECSNWIFSIKASIILLLTKILISIGSLFNLFTYYINITVLKLVKFDFNH